MITKKIMSTTTNSNSCSSTKKHHLSAHKLNSHQHGGGAAYNRINHSTSFVIAKSDSLDTCPKCGQNVCEHTSVADVINLPNSVSQDFSTYSSDSSLIKQLLSESTSSTGTVKSNNRLDETTNTTAGGGGLLSSSIGGVTASKLLPMETSLMFSQIWSQMNKQVPSLSNAATLQQQQQQQQQHNHLGGHHHQNATAMSNFITFNVLRPVSCQYVLDTETTDKLLKDFFESSASSNSTTTREKLLGLPPSSNSQNGALGRSKSEKMTQTTALENIDPELVELTASSSKQRPKKTKFSNFRLFLNNHSTSNSSKNHPSTTTSTTNKPSPCKPLLRSTNAFVNCLTSSSTSSSSSSCEDIAKRKTTTTTPNTTNNKHHTTSTSSSSAGTSTHSTTTTTSSASSTTKSSSVVVLHQQQQQLPLRGDEKKIVHNTITQQQQQQQQYQQSKSSNLNLNQSIVSLNSKFTNDLYDENDYNELHALELCPIVASDFDDDDLDVNQRNLKPAKSLISVKLNNMLTFDYQKKEFSTQTTTTEPQQQNKSVSASTITDDTHNTEITQIQKPEYITVAPSKSLKLMSNNMSSPPPPPQLDLDEQKKFAYRLKNRLSYFSSCSSCDFRSSSESRSSDASLRRDTNLNTNMQRFKYHSISVIFIIMALFSFNLVQESYLLFYYFSTEQFYWFTYALVALFTGQVLTLILSLVAEIDRVTPPSPVESQSSSSAGDLVHLTKSSKKNMNHHNHHHPVTLVTAVRQMPSNGRDDLYRVFTNPFTKLALIIPGFLPLCVYAHFLRTLFEYRKSGARNRFRLEFQLSLYLFLTALFFSLPITVLNSCYLASITKWGSQSGGAHSSSMQHHQQWYYSELFSVSTLVNVTSASDNIFGSSESSSSSAESTYSRFINRRQSQNPAAIASAATAGASGLLLEHTEVKNQFLLVLVSIFVSVSIGICVFATYHELMKQNYESATNPDNYQTSHGVNITTASKFRIITRPQRRANKMTTCKADDDYEDDLNISSTDSSSCHHHHQPSPSPPSSSPPPPPPPDLGLIEILVYFCYRFCLITSRLATLALVCYLFQQWLFAAVACHVLIAYCTSFLTLTTTTPVTTKKQQQQQQNITKSRLNRQLTLFIVCLLSFLDLFANQLSEMANLRKVFAYYVLYFAQNLSVCTYWLVHTIVEARQSEANVANAEKQHYSASAGSSKSSADLVSVLLSSNQQQQQLVAPKTAALFTTSSNQTLEHQQYYSLVVSPTATACYATLVYLCIILFTTFGLILKFLHLHIIRKRYRRNMMSNIRCRTAATGANLYS